eukprot:jgi/Bigna1/82793/fgenesh1_pg.97_\
MVGRSFDLSPRFSDSPLALCLSAFVSVLEKINSRVKMRDAAKKKKKQEERRKPKKAAAAAARPGSSYAPPIKRQDSRVGKILQGLPTNVQKELVGFSETDLIGLTKDDCVDICGSKAQGIRLYRRINPVSPQAKEHQETHQRAFQTSQPPQDSNAHAQMRLIQIRYSLYAERTTERKVLSDKDRPQQGTVAASSLLEGQFDERSGHADFLKAREEFLKGAAASAGTRTQIVQSSNETATSEASPADSSTAGTLYQHSSQSLMEGEFDEAGGHDAFLEARKAFLGEAGVHDFKDGKKDPDFNLPKSSDDGETRYTVVCTYHMEDRKCWKNCIDGNIGDGNLMRGKMLGIQDEQDDITTSRDQQQAEANGIGTNPDESSEKTSCYNCYKLFYKDKGLSDNEGHCFCSKQCLELDQEARGQQKEAMRVFQEKLRREQEALVQSAEATPVANREKPQVEMPRGPIVELPDDSSSECDE